MHVDLLYAMQNRTSKWLRLRERQKTFINSLTHMISIESQNIAYSKEACRHAGKQASRHAGSFTHIKGCSSPVFHTRVHR